MGLLSSSKSKSTTNVETTTQNSGFSEIQGDAAASQGNDTNNVTGAGAIGVRGEGNVLNMLDGGAIGEAFRFAETQSANTSKTLSESLASVTESARTESENTIVQLKSLAMYGLLAYAAVSVLKAVRQ